MNITERVNLQVRNAKNEYRKWGYVKASTVSCYPAMERWNAILSRYASFCRYMRETRHNWEDVRTVFFADGSVEKVQKSALTGELRTVQTTAPNGDICF